MSSRFARPSDSAQRPKSTKATLPCSSRPPPERRHVRHGRDGVRHDEDRRDTAGGGGARRVREVLLVRVAGVARMKVGVDEAGEDEQPRRVELLVRLGGFAGVEDGDDALVLAQDVRPALPVRRHHRAALNQESHPPPPSLSGTTKERVLAAAGDPHHLTFVVAAAQPAPASPAFCAHAAASSRTPRRTWSSEDARLRRTLPRPCSPKASPGATATLRSSRSRSAKPQESSAPASTQR